MRPSDPLLNLVPGDQLVYVGPHAQHWETWNIDIHPGGVFTFLAYTYRPNGTPRFITIVETPDPGFTWQLDEWALAPPERVMGRTEDPEPVYEDVEALIEKLAARYQGES